LHTTNEGDYFYGIRFKPPEIVEYDMEDPENINVFKKYNLIDNRNDGLIGLRYMSVNRNFVLHMMVDPVTQR
jgi:hypothetical protein